MYQLKYKVVEIEKKDGTKVNVIQWFIELEINGVKVPYVLKLDYGQSEFLQALIVDNK